MGGGRKKKASKKKMKNTDDDDSNSNSLLHHTNNTSSTHSHGTAEYPNSVGSDSAEEEATVDRKEVDVAETLENGSGSAYLSAYLSAVAVAIEDPPTIEDDREVAVVEESVIAERGEFKEESIVDELAVDSVIAERGEFKEESIVDELAVDSVIAERGEFKEEPIVDELAVDSEELSQIKDASVEVEDVQGKAVSSINTKSRGVVETDDEVAVAIPTSHVVDNGKELETHNKPSEDQPLIGLGSNPLPVQRTSWWAGCCGLFEVFSGGNR